MLQISNSSPVIIIDNSTLSITDGSNVDNCLTNLTQEIFAQLITPQIKGCSCCLVVADAQFLSINSNSLDYTPGVPPIVSTVSATGEYFCNSYDRARVNFGNFIGGSGQYMMTTNYYSNSGDALSANDFATVTTSKTYLGVPNGTWWFGLRDANNTSNVSSLAIYVNCDTNGGGGGGGSFLT